VHRVVGYSKIARKLPTPKGEAAGVRPYGCLQIDDLRESRKVFLRSASGLISTSRLCCEVAPSPSRPSLRSTVDAQEVMRQGSICGVTDLGGDGPGDHFALK
jgi:hypothetical protein